MATDGLGIGRKTLGSHTVVIHGLMMRNRAGVLPQTLLVSISLPYPQEAEQPVPPIQSAGGSQQSLRIDNYLRSALADFAELESESPQRIRTTSSPKARAAQMDAWKAKNGRRIRLIKKKYRGGGLNAHESAELTRLTSEVTEHVEHVSPRSTEALNEFEDFVSELRAEVEKKRRQPGS
jgi:hypothetical protein